MKSKEFLLPSGNQKIKGSLHFPEKGGLNPVVLICHGIPGGIPVPGDSGYLPLASKLAESGFLSVIFNFSGCGESTGSIDFNKWQENLFSVYEYVSEEPNADNSKIHILGFSAGGAIALKFASYEKKRLSSMMLMATPADFKEVIPDDPALLLSHFKSLGLIRNEPFHISLKAWHNGFKSMKPENLIRWLPRGLPVCIVQGDSDSVVPPEHGKRLYKAAQEPKKLIMLENAQHQLRKDPRISTIVLDWLEGNKI